MSEKKLEVRNLKISFRTNDGKVQAVRDISFDLYKGETLAIVGESGSGKSVTSKAILGIEAANVIHEGGEILYDGQDLMKIGEEDFYRIRGDKIAMIFQDPLSSLNPIMRIGKQLTEAMLLKGKARQRTSKENFDKKLSLLEKYMMDACPERASEIKSEIHTFRTFEMEHCDVERGYNTAYEYAQDAIAELGHQLTVVGRNDDGKEVTIYEKEKDNEKKNELSKIAAYAKRTLNEYVVTDSAALNRAVSAISGKVKDVTVSDLKTLNDLLTAAASKDKPDFSAIGYERKFATSGESMEAFMKRFHGDIVAALSLNHEKRVEQKKNAVKVLSETRSAFDGTDRDAIKNAIDKMSEAIRTYIDEIDLVKDSPAWTFTGSMESFLDRYDTGIKTNGKKLADHERQLAKYNRLIEKGRTPDWKVAAATVIDLDETRSNMQRQTGYMLEHLNAQLETPYDAEQEATKLITYLTECASGMVLKVTKQNAKLKALKLMQEVGIPEPRKRYRDYPFQFSGGMRQRIVIAIALAANPDILICDEPTTALDVTIQAQILELINKLKKERGLTIIFITHDLGVVANMADRIAVMYAGKIVEYGTSNEVFYSPAHPYTWALLSSMPDLDTKEKLEAIPGTPPNMIYPPVGDAFAERNRYAMKIDFEKQPPRFDITPTHWAATWLLHPDAPKVEPPKSVTNRIAKMKARMEEKQNG